METLYGPFYMALNNANVCCCCNLSTLLFLNIRINNSRRVVTAYDYMQLKEFSITAEFHIKIWCTFRGLNHHPPVLGTLHSNTMLINLHINNISSSAQGLP
jgi:hypothetical protein